jgi:hypothetical protein
LHSRINYRFDSLVKKFNDRTSLMTASLYNPHFSQAMAKRPLEAMVQSTRRRRSLSYDQNLNLAYSLSV